MQQTPLHAVSSGAANPPEQDPGPTPARVRADRYEWERNLAKEHPGTVPVSRPCAADEMIDMTVRVVTLGAVRLWLSRFQAKSYPDTERRAVAIRNWLSTQREHTNQVPFSVWCDLEVRRLKALGIVAWVYTVPENGRLAVVRTEVPR